MVLKVWLFFPFTSYLLIEVLKLVFVVVGCCENLLKNISLIKTQLCGGTRMN